MKSIAGVSRRSRYTVASPASAAYPSIPIKATGIPKIDEYSLRFTMSQLNVSPISQYAVFDVA